MAAAVIENLRTVAGRRMPFLPRLLTGVVWNGISNALNQGATFVITIIIARLLAKEEFGQFAMIQSTLLTIATLAQLGVSYSATKHIAEFRSIDPQKTGRIIGLCSVVCPGLGLLGALIIALSAHLVAARALNAPQLTLPLVIGAGFVFFTAVNSYQIGALIGLEQYKALVLPGAVSSVVTIALVAAGCLIKGVDGAIAGLSTGTAIRCWLHRNALNGALRRLNIRIHYKGLGEEIHILYDFALPAAISGYIMMPCAWWVNSLLVRQEGGYIKMASYSAALSLRTAVMFLPYLINAVGLSILNNVRRSPERRSYRQVHEMNILVIGGVAGVLAAVVAAAGKILLATFGKGYSDTAYTVLLILLGSAVVESCMIATYQAIQSRSWMWSALAAITVPWQGSFVAAACWLVPRNGAVGLAYSNLIGMMVALVCTVAVVRFRKDNSASRIELDREEALEPAVVQASGSSNTP